MTSCANATSQVNERQRQQQQLGIISAEPRPYARRPPIIIITTAHTQRGNLSFTHSHTHRRYSWHNERVVSKCVCVCCFFNWTAKGIDQKWTTTARAADCADADLLIYLYCAAAVIIVIVRRRARLQCIARHHNVKAFPRYRRIKMTDDRSDDCVRRIV